MRRLLVAQTLPEIDLLQTRWHELYRMQGDATMFQSFHWNRVAAQIFREEQPFVVFVESDAGAALIPAAVRRSRQLCLLGEQLFDYRDVLWTGDPSVLAEAWRILAKTGLPLAQTPVRALDLQRNWSTSRLVPFCKAPCVSSDLSAEYFASSHTRLSRQVRRLARAGVEIRRHNGNNLSLLREIYAHKAAPSTGYGENLFRDRCRVDFVLAVAAGDPVACQVFTFEAPSALAAALVTFQDRMVRRFYTTWFDPAWARYSPGVALLFEATRLTLAEGLACDYMTGEQDYKLRLANGAVPLCHASGEIRNSAPTASETELPVAG